MATTTKPKPPLVPDDQPESEDQRPRILAFFERVGLVKGEVYQTVVMNAAGGRTYIGPAEIVDIAAVGEHDRVVPDEIVIAFTEPGMKGALHRVRYSQLVSWSKLPE